MSVFLSIHRIRSVGDPQVKELDKSSDNPNNIPMPAYVRSTVEFDVEGQTQEITFFADSRDKLGVLGADVMTSAEVAALVIDSLESEWGPDMRTTDEERRAANNIAKVLKGVWVRP